MKKKPDIWRLTQFSVFKGGEYLELLLIVKCAQSSLLRVTHRNLQIEYSYSRMLKNSLFFKKLYQILRLLSSYLLCRELSVSWPYWGAKEYVILVHHTGVHIQEYMCTHTHTHIYRARQRIPIRAEQAFMKLECTSICTAFTDNWKVTKPLKMLN